jgi:hypothetical protein
MPSEDISGFGFKPKREQTSAFEYEENIPQKSVAKEVIEDDYEAESISSDQSSHMSPVKLSNKVESNRSDRLKYFTQSNHDKTLQPELLDRIGSSIPRQLDRHKSGDESIFETERRRNSFIGTSSNNNSNEGASPNNVCDISKSIEVFSNSAECDIGRSSSHNSGLRINSNSKRLGLRKAFAVDQLYVPAGKNSFSVKDTEAVPDKNGSSQSSLQEVDSVRLEDSYDFPNGDHVITHGSNHNSSSSYNYGGSFNNNSYTDISFVRPDQISHTSPQKENRVVKNNGSPPAPNRNGVQQHVQSKSQDEINAKTTNTNNNSTRPQSPRRVLPKHLHQVFGPGGSVPVNGAVNSFIPRHLAATQINKRREKNRLTQYTKSASMANLSNSVISGSSAMLSVDSNAASSNTSSDNVSHSSPSLFDFQFFIRNFHLPL